MVYLRGQRKREKSGKKTLGKMDVPWQCPQVKNLPAIQETQETQVQSLGWEDILEEEMATHPLFLLGNPTDRGA